MCTSIQQQNGSRLPGFELPEVPYFPASPYQVEQLVADPDARARLVDQVLRAHPAETTAVTPPHFLVHDDRSANLNVVLAEDTRNSTDKPVRATVVVASRYAARAATEVALHYAGRDPAG